MKRLKDRLAKTDNKYVICGLLDCFRVAQLCLKLTSFRFNKERAKSTRKLKLILDALEEKQLWKDHALMAAVEQLVRWKHRWQ